MALALTLTWKKIEIAFPKFPTAHQSVLFTPSLWPLGTKPILIVTLMTLGTRAKVSKQGCILSCRVEGGIKCPSFTTKICLKKIVFLTLHSKWIYLATLSPFVFIYNILLLSNSEDREHLKNFRNVDCVLANHKKVQDKRANPQNHKLITVVVCGLVTSHLIGLFLATQ